MRRDEFLRCVRAKSVAGDLPAQLGPPRQDSRTVTPGDVFFALPGLRCHGATFAAEAVARGATAVVCDVPVCAEPRVEVADVREAYGAYASAYYGHPSHALQVIGVTGTNGKTTTVHLLQGILRAAGLRTATVGTLGIRTDDAPYQSTGYTTPLPENLHAALAQLRDDRVEAVAIEVSSQGLDMGRHVGVRFAGALFTNLTPEHLDYHGTMEAYRQAKMRLFAELPTDSWAGANVEDPYGVGMLEAAPSRVRLGFGVGVGDVEAADVHLAADAARFTLLYRGMSQAVHLPLVGRYNLENALCASTGALAMGIDLRTIAEGLAHPPRVPGRMERTTLPNGVHVLIDYAHTPDGFAKVFTAVRSVMTGRIFTVFGCGGDRDRVKRPIMGEIAGRMSDHVILTTDNPRSEEPEAIAQEVARGIEEAKGHWEFVKRRDEAIERAVSLSRPGDTVLVLGKGAESYQIIGNTRVPYSEHAVVMAMAHRMSASPVATGSTPDPQP